MASLPKGYGYCPFQCPVEASCAPIFWRRLGLPQEEQLLCYGTTHSVGLDNTGKTYPFSLEQERCGSSDLPEGNNIWTIFRCIWKIGGDCNPLGSSSKSARETQALRLYRGIYTYEIQKVSTYGPQPSSGSHGFIKFGTGAGRSATSSRRGDGGARQGLQLDSLEQFLASRPETGAPQCFYPFEVRTQEETGSTRRL